VLFFVVVVVVPLGAVAFEVVVLLVVVEELDCLFVAAWPNANPLIANESRSALKVFMVVPLQGDVPVKMHPAGAHAAPNVSPATRARGAVHPSASPDINRVRDFHTLKLLPIACPRP
jgi:hypothetical protein